MRFRVATLATAALAAATLALLAPAAFGQAGAETFTATASVKMEDASAKSPVRIEITRWSTDAERASVMKAVKTGGTHAVHAILEKMPDAGSIDLGGKKVAIKYAYANPTGSGRLVTIATADPIHHLGGNLPDAKSKAGYDVAVAILVLEAGDQGHGELAPAAKVKTNESGAIVIDDYGSAKIWLQNIAKTK